MNHTFIPYKPPASITIGAYEADKEKVRNVAPVGKLLEELNKVYETQPNLPLPPTPDTRPTPLPDRLPDIIRGASQRASQFLRDLEEEKLLGGR